MHKILYHDTSSIFLLYNIFFHQIDKDNIQYHICYVSGGVVLSRFHEHNHPHRHQLHVWFGLQLPHYLQVMFDVRVRNKGKKLFRCLLRARKLKCICITVGIGPMIYICIFFNPLCIHWLALKMSFFLSKSIIRLIDMHVSRRPLHLIDDWSDWKEFISMMCPCRQWVGLCSGHLPSVQLVATS